MDVCSAGYACGLFQIEPRLLQVGVAYVQGKAKAEPAIRINGVAHYHQTDVTAAVAWLKELDAKETLAKAQTTEKENAK